MFTKNVIIHINGGFGVLKTKIKKKNTLKVSSNILRSSKIF